MATQNQVASFIDQFAPYAQDVSKLTGLTPAEIIGQWGLETGWGTQSNFNVTHNLGNIMSNGKLNQYPDFFTAAQSYAAVIKGRTIPKAQGDITNPLVFGQALEAAKYAPFDAEYKNKIAQTSGMVVGVRPDLGVIAEGALSGDYQNKVNNQFSNSSYLNWLSNFGTSGAFVLFGAVLLIGLIIKGIKIDE